MEIELTAAVALRRHEFRTRHFIFNDRELVRTIITEAGARRATVRSYGFQDVRVTGDYAAESKQTAKIFFRNPRFFSIRSRGVRSFGSGKQTIRA